MSVQRARTLSAIYRDVQDYDLVLVPDAPLASAINRRLDHPHFGTFATTPRRLAAGRREQAEDRLAFLDIIEETDQAWKATAYAIGNVLQCWEHNGTADAILEYDAYVDETTRDVVEAMSRLDSTSRQLTEYTHDEDQSLAVVGEEQLTELERSVLPEEYDSFELFTDESFDHPPFHIFDSSTGIIDALLNTITEENAENDAVVLDGSSRYSSLVESAFEAADIPFYGGPGFIDDPDHRSFLRLLRLAYRGSETQVADVKPLLTRLGVDLSVEHDEKRLSTVEFPETEWIAEFCEAVGERTFAEALDEYERTLDRTLPTLGEELEALIESIMREVIISRDRKYILENYDDITIDDREISVPERKPRLITPDDPRLDELYSDIVDTVIGSEDEEDSGLNIPYVSADRYDADGDEEEELIIEYQNASILMLINLLKRLESSLAAFESSVERLMERERITRHIATGELDDADARREAVEQIRDTFEDDFAKDVDFEDVAEAIERVGPSIRDDIVADIDEDLKELERLKRQAQNALQTEEGGRMRDAKAERLRTLIERELSDEKVLIFSQYVPTITHLFEQLTGENPANTNVGKLGREPGNPTVGYVHGGGGFDERIVERFAPEAQNADVGPDEEIDILFATDVLGVGQNLQDSRVVVNYDLHWNPMKMEQRIGRIDRITTRHDELWIYNFAPTGDLRKQLGLIERIEEKIQDIASTFGHAAPILDSAEEQVHKTLMTYERLEEGGAEFGDERLEGIGSKYDDLRNTVKAFCEEHDVEIDELQETSASIESRSEPQYFITPIEEDGYVTLTQLEHSSGRTEWRTTIFDSDRLQSTTIGGQAVFTQFPRLETDDVRVFNTIASPDTTRYTIPEDDLDELQSLSSELGNPSTWENDILSRQTGESDVITDIKQLCRNLVDSDEEISEEAAEIVDLLDEHEMSDWAENELRTIHRRRRRYGINGTIRRLHHKLTEEIELVDPETVIEADVALTGQLSPDVET